MRKPKRTAAPSQSVQREHQWAVRELVARYCLLAQVMAAEIEQKAKLCPVACPTSRELVDV